MEGACGGYSRHLECPSAPLATWHPPPPPPLPTWQIVSLVLSCFAWLWLLVGFGVYVDKCLPTDEISFDGGIDLNFIPVSG